MLSESPLLSDIFVQTHHIFHLCLTIFRFSCRVFAQRCVTSTTRLEVYHQKCFGGSWKRHKHGANGRAKGKCGLLDLFSILLLLFFKYPLHCAPLIWVSWGTFCLTDVIVCLCLSCVCGIYESQPGSSVIFLSGWRSEHFRTHNRVGMRQVGTWVLSVSCCDVFSVIRGGMNVQVCAVQGPPFCPADAALRRFLHVAGRMAPSVSLNILIAVPPSVT